MGGPTPARSSALCLLNLKRHVNEEQDGKGHHHPCGIADPEH